MILPAAKAKDKAAAASSAAAPAGAASADANADTHGDGDEADVVDIMIGADAKAIGDVPKAADPERKGTMEGFVAAHYQRQLDVNLKRKRIFQNFGGSLSTLFNNPMLKQPVALGPKVVMSAPPGQDMLLPEQTLKPGTDKSKIGKYGFVNALVFTDPSQSIIIQVPNELLLNGESGNILNLKLGYLTEVSSGNIRSNSGKTTAIKDCVIRAKNSIIIESEAEVHLEMDHAVAWGNKPEYPSFTPSFKPFKGSEQLLRETRDAAAAGQGGAAITTDASGKDSLTDSADEPDAAAGAAASPM